MSAVEVGLKTFSKIYSSATVQTALKVSSARKFGIGSSWFSSKITGDLSDTKNFLVNAFKYRPMNILRHYGELGVRRLQEATPVDSGTTAASWSYEITQEKDQLALTFSNSNIHENCNVAYLLQMGHGTRQGGYIPGINYINPALQPIFDDIAQGIFEEVANL